jgi:hypothetical protein
MYTTGYPNSLEVQMSAMLDREEHWQRVRELDALRDEITKLAGQLNAANYRFLKLIAEFDRRKGWARDETHSCAHWLNWKCGIDLGAAREKVRVARALENLPLLSEAMARGEISYSKVRAITRVACPATESSLLMLARYGTAHHVEKMVRCYRRAKDAEELSREHRQQLERAVTYSFDDDGSLILKARLPAEAGAIVLKALNLAMQVIPADQVQESLRDHQCTVDSETGERKVRVKSVSTARRADALRLVAETFLRQEAVQSSGGDTHQIVVHVSAETLRSNAAGCCELEEGPAISAETARCLSCDASIVALIEDEDGEPLNVGRKTRAISAPLRRFLNARDKGCRFPGCTNTRFIHAHHIKHWAQGGETKPSNLVSLCSFHHRKVHEGGMRVEVLDDGAVCFIRPDGTAIDSVAQGCTQPLSDWTEIPQFHREHGIHIDARTAVTRWRGEQCDYGLGVEVLLAKARRGKARSGKTRFRGNAKLVGSGQLMA